METAIKPKKRLAKVRSGGSLLIVFLPPKNRILVNLHLRYLILAQAWAQRARSIAFLRGPRNYRFSDLVNEINQIGIWSCRWCPALACRPLHYKLGLKDVIIQY